MKSSTPTSKLFSGFFRAKAHTSAYHPIQDTQTEASSTGLFTHLPATDAPSNHQPLTKTQFVELNAFLDLQLSRGHGPRFNSPATARQKLTYLTALQFSELSTDVYDELVRRKNKGTPYLPARETFCEKRNQARQKFASLPDARFVHLVGDVGFELARRFPELQVENNAH